MQHLHLVQSALLELTLEYMKAKKRDEKFMRNVDHALLTHDRGGKWAKHCDRTAATFLRKKLFTAVEKLHENEQVRRRVRLEFASYLGTVYASRVNGFPILKHDEHHLSPIKLGRRLYQKARSQM